MRASVSVRPVYRRPQELEACWECTRSGRRFAYDPSPDEAGVIVKPRCPCHQRLMRRTHASWHGCPAWAAWGLLGGISVSALWTWLSVACAVPALRTLLGHC